MNDEKMKIEEITWDAICEDPYQIGCTEDTAYVRIGEIRPQSDAPIYLCGECFCQMLVDGDIDEDEWEPLIL